MKFVLVIFLLVVFSFTILGVQPVKEFDVDSIDVDLKLLSETYGQNKTVSSDLSSKFYTALSFYPKFKNTKIKVIRKNIKTTMQCRPRWDYFLHRKENRTYLIFVDSEIQDDNGVLFEDLPFNAQIGVFGHELAHIADYETKNDIGIIALGIKYIFPKQHKEIEHNVDKIAIEQGLGYQINAFSVYVFEESKASSEYLKFKRKFYFKPRQISQIMANTPIYSSN